MSQLVLNDGTVVQMQVRDWLCSISSDYLELVLLLKPNQWIAWEQLTMTCGVELDRDEKSESMAKTISNNQHSSAKKLAVRLVPHEDIQFHSFTLEEYDDRFVFQKQF